MNLNDVRQTVRPMVDGTGAADEVAVRLLGKIQDYGTKSKSAGYSEGYERGYDDGYGHGYDDGRDPDKGRQV